MNDPRTVDRLGRAALGAVFAAVLALAWLQGVRPLMAAQRDLASYRTAVRILSEAQASAQRLDAQVRSLSTEVSRTEALLPRSLNLDAFLEQMDTLAKHSGVRLVSLAPDRTAEHDLYREMFLEAQIEGSYPSIYGFLVRLERGSRLLSLTELAMSREAEGGLCGARFRMALYFAREAAG